MALNCAFMAQRCILPQMITVLVNRYQRCLWNDSGHTGSFINNPYSMAKFNWLNRFMNRSSYDISSQYSLIQIYSLAGKFLLGRNNNKKKSAQWGHLVLIELGFAWVKLRKNTLMKWCTCNLCKS